MLFHNVFYFKNTSKATAERLWAYSRIELELDPHALTLIVATETELTAEIEDKHILKINSSFLVRGDEFLGKKPGERVSSKLADRSVKPTPMINSGKSLNVTCRHR